MVISKYAVTLALVLSVGTMAFAGGTKEAASAQKPRSITVAVQAGAPEPAIYKKLAADWEQSSGINIEWVDLPQPTQHDQLVTGFASKSGVYDVVAVDQEWVAEFAAAGYIDPLNDRLGAEKSADFFSKYLDLESYRGKLYAIPQYMFAPVMYYRTDLFKKYGFRMPTLDQPLTQDEFVNDSIQAMKGEGKGFWGTVVEAKRSPVSQAVLAEYIYRFGGTLIDSQGNPHVNDPADVKAFQFMSDLVNKFHIAPPGASSMDNVDNHTMFMQGNLLMAVNWPYALSLISDPQQSKVADKFAVTVSWGADKSTTILGGWGMALPTDSKKKDAAWDFIKFITNTKEQYLLRKQSFQAPTSKSELDMLNADTTLSDLQRASLGAMVKAVELGSTLPAIPQWNAVADRLNIAEQQTIDGQMTAQQALDAAQADIKKILGK